MVVTHSSMKTKQVETPRHKKNVYVVENAEPDIVETNRMAEQQKMAEPVVVAPPIETKSLNRKMFEDLVFLGAVSDIIDIQGHKFTVSTLTLREQNELMREVYKFGDAADLFTVRTSTLAYCVKSVDGMDLEQIDMGGVFDSAYEKRLAILESMQKSVIEKLYDFYAKLSKTSEENIKGAEEEIKNS